MIRSVRHYPEKIAVEMTGDPRIGMISITEPGRYAQISPGRWGAVLCLWFHDVDTQNVGGLTLFDEHHADRILDWLNRHEDSLRGIIVHCGLGISRSAAVAKFIAERYALPFNERNADRYNRRVYRVLWDRWTEDPKVQERILRNRERNA